MRIPRGVTRRGLAAAVTAVSLAALAGCAGAGAKAQPSRVTDEGAPRQVAPAGDAGRAGKSAPRPVPPAGLPGLGPRTSAEVPADARQVVVVVGAGQDSSRSVATFYRLDPVRGWTAAGPAWPAHNAVRGWTEHHRTGDLRSPVGVFTLTDAGGRLPDPGTKLTYDHAPIGFTVHGTGFEGEPLRGAFDYVIAINYNRKPGMSPRDWTRPLGQARGGGIWLHVDHGGPTQACVSLPKAVMRTLLRTLDPALHPVVVMGDGAALAR